MTFPLLLAQANASACTQAGFPPAWNKCIDFSQPSLQSIVQLVINLIQIALTIAGALAVVFIILGGIKYITSAGSPDGTKAAKKTLSSAVIGLVVAVLAYFIVGFVIGAL